MNRHMPITFSAIFLLITFFPCQALAASITETSAAIGEGCVASGANSTAMGYSTTADGISSTAMGQSTTASGSSSTAMGYYTTAARLASTAMGYATIARGDSSTALGRSTTASGNYSTAMGHSTTADGFSSTAMGRSTTASGDYSTAMGIDTTASGDYSAAVGNLTVAGAESSWAGGRYMQLTDTAGHTFVWGDSVNAQSISAADAFLIFPAGTEGKVGIGTKNPQNLLDLGDSQGKKLAVFQKTTGADFYGFGISSNTLEIYAGVVASATTPAMVVKKTSGNVDIGTASPDYKLEVNGSAGKLDGGSWSNSSDARLKDITGEYDRGLDAVISLKPVIFYYKEGNPRGLPTDEEYVGFVAQEVKDVFPKAVSEGKDGYLDFNMHPVNVAVVNAIKELKAENEALRVENSAFKEDQRIRFRKQQMEIEELRSMIKELKIGGQ